MTLISSLSRALASQPSPTPESHLGAEITAAFALAGENDAAPTPAPTPAPTRTPTPTPAAVMPGRKARLCVCARARTCVRVCVCVCVCLHRPENFLHAFYLAEFALLFLLTHHSWHEFSQFVKHIRMSTEQSDPFHQLVHLCV